MSRFCGHLIGFVVLLASLLGWPHAAAAHGGHVPGMRVHAHTHGHAQAGHASTGPDHSLQLQAEPSLAAAASDATGEADLPCERGCCVQASCAACFSLVAPMLPQVAPPSLGSLIVFSASADGAGIDRPSLRRPPKSFA